MSLNNTSSEPLTLEQETEQLNAYLDKFELECFLPQSVNENTVSLATDLLNTDFSTFNKTPEECAIAAAILSQYAFNLQRVINREGGVVHWANARINKVIGPIILNQKAYGKEDRNAQRNLAISSSPLAQRLFELVTKTELKLKRIETLYFSIKNIADKYTELQKTLPKNRD